MASIARRATAGMIKRILMLAAGAATFASAAADWPQWRGPNRDGFTSETLPAALPDSPSPLWKTPAGRGYASPVVAGGRFFILEDNAGQELAELWRAPVGLDFADEFEPGPRCTPVVDGDLVFTQTCRGEFRCLGAKDGVVRWRFAFADYGAPWSDDRNNGPGAAARRGNAGSPVVAGRSVIVQVGAPQGAALAAFEKTTGRLLWKSQNDLTCYASPILATLGGAPSVVTATCEGLLALNPDDGRELWRVRFKTAANRNVVTPVAGDDTVYYASFSTGLRAEKVAAGPEGPKVREAWLNPDQRIHLATPVLAGGFLFGMGPFKSKSYTCISAADGRTVWVPARFQRSRLDDHRWRPPADPRRFRRTGPRRRIGVKLEGIGPNAGVRRNVQPSRVRRRDRLRPRSEGCFRMETALTPFTPP
jgi:outer membrane protein assembly factor BamB